MTVAAGFESGRRPGAIVAEFAESIKIQHSVFALPFAVLGILLAVKVAGFPGWWTILGALGCCVLARTAAMACNRYLDADIDARNPRTQSRAVPAGRLSPGFMLWVTVLCSVGFVAVAAAINPLAGWLSPLALLVVLGYSYMKRFTAWCHAVLGFALGIAPVGGYIAVTGRFDLAPVLLGLGVLLWTAGFDIIYACQDEDFDRAAGLNSVPALLGYKTALRLAVALHCLCIPVIFLAGWLGGLGYGYIVGCVAVAGILAAQHLIVWHVGPRGISMAFFTVNGWTGVALLGLTLIGQWLGFEV